MNKNALIITLSALFLIASAIYSYTQKKSYTKAVQEATIQANEIEQVAQLQKLWGAKGIVSKLNRVLQNIPSNKKVGSRVGRKKANLRLANLTDRELNRVLSSLAKLPVQFKNLNIAKHGENYLLECLCVW